MARRQGARKSPPPATQRPRLVAPGTRHREVLDVALRVMADEGYAGASLRRIAAELGMQQPSLYHYFASKEELIEQIIETYSGEMLQLGQASFPDRVDDLPQLVRRLVFSIYETPTHPLFVRVAFSVSRMNPRYGALLREIFTDRTTVLMRHIAREMVRDDVVTESDVVDLMRLVVNAIGFRLMEEKVLFDDRELGPDVERFADFVVDTAVTMLRSLRRRSGRSRRSGDRR